MNFDELNLMDYMDLGPGDVIEILELRYDQRQRNRDLVAVEQIEANEFGNKS